MDKKLIIFLPLLSGIFWGGGGVFVRILNSCGLDNVSIFASRVVLATILLFMGLLVFDRNALKIKLNDIWLFIGSGIFGMLLLNVCYNEAAFTLTLSLASVLLSIAPVFALFLSAIFFGENITKRKILCLILVIVGCLLVCGVFESSIDLSLHGVIFGVLSAIFWALYGVFSRISTDKGYSTYTVIFYSFLFASLMTIPFSDWSMFYSFLMADPITNIPLAFAHSLFISIAPYVLFTVALKYVENGKATILCGGAEPTSATIFGLLIFLEVPTLLSIAGIIITIAALSLLVDSNKNS